MADLAIQFERAPTAPGRVLVRRGGHVESIHAVHVAVVDADGRGCAAVGDAQRATFYRSAAKPLQAIPLIDDGVAENFGIEAAELGLCCGSHNSERRHVETARRILDRCGSVPTALACGGHPPLRAEEAWRLATEGRRPGALESNCSGKHAGMVALALHHGWPVAGYQRRDHPVQRRVAAEVARWAGVAVGDLETGVDGCGVVCFRLPLARIALSFAALARSAAEGGSASRIVAAMTGHPGMVAGEGRLDTVMMQAFGDTVFTKVGAEGVYAAGLPGRGLGVALKVEDGAARAADVALVRVLDALGVTAPDRGGSGVDRFRRPLLRNTRSEEVGCVEADFGVVMDA